MNLGNLHVLLNDIPLAFSYGNKPAKSGFSSLYTFIWRAKVRFVLSIFLYVLLSE